MKKNIKCVLLDLDNTLLPMDQDAFFASYVETVAGLVECDQSKKAIAKAIWASSNALYHNDGSQLNKDLFWATMTNLLGDGIRSYEDQLDDLQRDWYDDLKKFAHPTAAAPRVVNTLKEQGYRLVLATNPVSSLFSQEARTRWAGLDPYDFDLITAYENSHGCKPSPIYFEEIMKKQHLNSWECVMVGNDAYMDMAARNLGIDVFLVTTHLDNSKNLDISGYPQGSLDDFCREITR